MLEAFSDKNKIPFKTSFFKFLKSITLDISLKLKHIHKLFRALIESSENN